MLDNEPTGAAGANQNDDINPATGRPRRRAASRPAGPPPEVPAGSETAAEPSAPARRRAKKTAASDAPPAPPVTGRRRKKAAAAPVEVSEDEVDETEIELDADGNPIVTDEEPAEGADAE